MRIVRSLVVALAVFVGASWPATPRAQETGWHGNYFPNVILQDQDGNRLRFYDDMIRGKIVAINFIYTNCNDICPLDTAQMRQVQQRLGDRVGRDIFIYSISLNPEQDTPATLRRFMRTYDVGPGWRFLTGSRADIDELQRRLGIRPVEQNNLRAHDTSFMLGNETTGQWIKRSAFENPAILADVLSRTLTNFDTPGPSNRRSYAEARQVSETSQGGYVYRTRCASCHSIGEGDRLGPDLLGVTNARPRPWLTRWIKEPDAMIAERDPTALAMMARYRNLPMPNVGLSNEDVQAVLEYLERRDADSRPASGR